MKECGCMKETTEPLEVSRKDRTMKPYEYCKLTDQEAREHIESLRWPEGPVCIHCGSMRVTSLHGHAHRKGLKKCKDCRKQFTVTVGTIFEDSHVQLQHWLYAIARMCSSKKGISAKQLERETGVMYKTAWFMCHRIRHAMKYSTDTKLTGIVQVDETYVGGRPRKVSSENKRGRGTKKAAVVALVSSDGRSRSETVVDVTHKTLREVIERHVDESATIATDEFSGYKGIGDSFAGGHKTVNHSKGVYKTDDGVHTNTVEAYFALLKRGVYGTFHKISKKHLQRYCDEFAFRWDHRDMKDGEIIEVLIRATEGKRLVWSTVIAGGQ